MKKRIIHTLVLTCTNLFLCPNLVFAEEETSTSSPTSCIDPAYRKIPGEEIEPINPNFCKIEKSSAPNENDYETIHNRWNMFYQGKWYDPYNQNILKGDIPIFGSPGHEWFLELDFTSLSLVEGRNLPTPVGGASTERSQTNDVLGRTDQLVAEENLIFQIALIRGNTVFKPQEFEFRATPILNFNYANVDETGFLRVDPSRGSDRDDFHFGFKELFADIHLADLSERYDFASTRVGIQRFNSDFRGFVFFDEAPGARVFGTLDNNHYQWNLAWFSRLDKDVNSLQNKVFDMRDEQVIVANLYKQDLFFLGHTVEGVVIHREDTAGDDGLHYDDNGFLVRPASIGSERAKNVYNTYLGLNSDGHIGPINVNSSYYYTFGSESHNAIADKATKIDAHMGALEISHDFNWVRLKTSVFYASGDKNPYDDRATGFDTIFDNPQFAGGDTSYWQRQGIPFIGGGGVALVNRFSLIPDLKPGKEQGQSNFVNPGLRLYNVGADLSLTPKLQLTSNATYLQFDRTESLEVLRQDGSIDNSIGFDLSTGIIYRPFLNNNVQIRLAGGALLPSKGLKNLYGDDTLYHGFTNLIFNY